MSDAQERLIQEALSAGLITPEQVEEARAIQKTVAEIGITQSLAEILVKKEHLTEQQVRTLQREIDQKRIGKYEILEKIGEGGIGAVYKVRHRLLEEVRVIKVLRPEAASKEDLR